MVESEHTVLWVARSASFDPNLLQGASHIQEQCTLLLADWLKCHLSLETKPRAHIEVCFTNLLGFSQPSNINSYSSASHLHIWCYFADSILTWVYNLGQEQWMWGWKSGSLWILWPWIRYVWVFTSMTGSQAHLKVWFRVYRLNWVGYFFNILINLLKFQRILW